MTKDPNANFMQRMDKNNPLKIRLDPKAKSGVVFIPDIPDAGESPKLLRSHGQLDDFLIRRRTGGIVFYDLGRELVEGNFVTRETEIPRDAVDYDDLRDFYNYPLSLSLASWKDKFKKVTKSEGYIFGALFSKDSEPINDDDKFLGADNPNWSDAGYKLTQPFNELEVIDPNYLFWPFQSTMSPSSRRITASIDPEDDDIDLPDLNPKTGEIRIYLSPTAVALDAQEPPYSPGPGTQGSFADQSPAYYPNPPVGYPEVTACSTSTNPFPGEPDWTVAEIAEDEGYSESGELGLADSEYLTPLDRVTALVTALMDEEDDSPGTGDILNYAAASLEVDYFLDNWEMEGKTIWHRAKYDGSGTYTNRNWLCYEGQIYPGPGIAGITLVRSIETTSTHDVDPTTAFSFDDSFTGGLDTPMESIPASDSTGENAALLAAINQNDNWYFIWHVNRYIEF